MISLRSRCCSSGDHPAVFDRAVYPLSNQCDAKRTAQLPAIYIYIYMNDLVFATCVILSRY